jgi:DNA-binding CsgD family transcriptional regulator
VTTAALFSDAPEAPVPARPALSPRERTALNAITEGLSDAQLAERLHVSRRTARSVLDRLALVLGTRDRPAMVAAGYRRGFLAAPGSPPVGRGVVSAAEFEVLLLTARGLTDEEIADRLGVEVGAVKYHQRRLRESLAARNRTHLVRRAVDAGVLRLVPKGCAP